MELDGSIVRLGAKLDEWLDSNLSTVTSQSPMSRGKALSAGIEITKELDVLKTRALKAISMLLNRQDWVSDKEHVASLIRGFEFAAKLKAALHDELLDVDSANKFVPLMNELVNALDVIDSGRTALAMLLEHTDPSVRASAGAYLLMANLMPDRVVPILREIDQKGDASSANFTAHWALLDWELKHRTKVPE